MTTTASPHIESTNIKFQDLFDLEEIQIVQDAFAKATCVASIITDTDGRPITKPSNFCRLCRDIIRETEKGLNNCMYSDAVLGRGNPNGPTMQPCLSGGLWDGGASIMVGDKHIANWLIGQVRNEQQDEEGMLAYAREIGADEEAFRVALAEVNIMSTEQFSHVCQALFVMAKQMSTLAYQNVLQARTIHERDEVEEALRESEERFRQVAMTNWVWEVDLEGRYTYCSENVIDTLGYSREEIIGKTPFDFMSQEEASRVGEILTELIASRKHIIDLENWNVTKNGSEICLLTNGVPFYGKTGNLIGYRGGDKDITDRKRAELELVKHQDQLELLVEDRTLKLKEAQAELIQGERLATLGSLTATVSHELRNPLGTIQTTLFSIEDSLERNDSSQVARSLELAERSINRCVTIIEELNSYARVKDLDISETSVDYWLGAVFKEQSIPEEICCELDLSCGVRASFDDEKLRQVVINLIANAVHALQDKLSNGKHLRVSTHLLDDKYEIRVSDNGIGMTHDIKEKVFEPLFSTKGFGVGLGMVIVKNIIDQHHGEINIESKEGEGTTVTLRLPINFSRGSKSQTI